MVTTYIDMQIHPPHLMRGAQEMYRQPGNGRSVRGSRATICIRIKRYASLSNHQSYNNLINNSKDQINISQTRIQLIASPTMSNEVRVAPAS